jgi:hypothetical protein
MNSSIAYLQFIRSIRWNTLEAIAYQAIFVAHQMILFRAVDPTFFGMVGTIFSALYVIITLANMGFDASISPFFNELKLSKLSFKKYIIPHLIPEYVALSLCAVIFYLNLDSIAAHIPWMQNVDSCLAGVLGLLVITEGIKKTARIILQLAFQNQVTATVDIVMIIFYVSTVWTFSMINHSITLFTIFVPMLCASFMSAAMLTAHVFNFYKNLPAQSEVPLGLSHTRIIKSRLFNYLNQMGHVVFSGNIMVPLFAMHCGLASAGVIKLLSTVTHAITIIINKIFSVPSEALFGILKNEDATVQRTTFTKITEYVHGIIIATTIFFITSHHFLLYNSAHTVLESDHLIIILFFMVQLSEQLFTVYEKFFITKEKSLLLFIFNIFVMSLLAITMHSVIPFGPMISLLAMLVIRITSFSTLCIISFYTWQIKPTYKINIHYIVAPLMLSLMLFLLRTIF